MPLRLIFMGTPEFAVPTLLELVAHGHEIAAVYTRAARPAGRGMKLQPTPVEQEARRLGIPVLTPATLKTPEAQAEFRAHNGPAAQDALAARLAGVPLTFEPHLEFKKRVPHAIGLIRTGDVTPYANLILESA